MINRGCVKIRLSPFCRGVACYARNSALCAALLICILPHIAPTGRRALSAAACYALHRKVHNESTPLLHHGRRALRTVACYARNSALRAALVICILPHITPTLRRALSAAACYALSPTRRGMFLPLPCRGVACYARNSALRAASVICILPHIAPTGPSGVRTALSARMVGSCRGAACYALRRKAHNESMPLLHHGPSALRTALRRKVHNESAPLLHHGSSTLRTALSTRMVGSCRGAACYALRRKAHNESMRKMVGFCRGVACYARNSALRAALVICIYFPATLLNPRPSGVRTHGPSALRIALSTRMVGSCRGAACYALRRKAHNESTPLLHHGPSALRTALRRKAHNESTRKVMLCFDTPPSSQVVVAKGSDRDFG